ncbi:MAG: hypothetical protein HC915_19455, partial [Anaerolineae bacterium]|nr:hypothetical protein [Anaerolineae bacterium]
MPDLPARLLLPTFSRRVLAAPPAMRQLLTLGHTPTGYEIALAFTDRAALLRWQTPRCGLLEVQASAFWATVLALDLDWVQLNPPGRRSSGCRATISRPWPPPALAERDAQHIALHRHRHA